MNRERNQNSILTLFFKKAARELRPVCRSLTTYCNFDLFNIQLQLQLHFYCSFC